MLNKSVSIISTPQTAESKICRYFKFKDNGVIPTEQLEKIEELITASANCKDYLNNKNDFKIKKVNDLTNKLRIIELVKERGGYKEDDKGVFKITNKDVDYTDLIKEYETVFKPRSKNNDITTENQCESWIFRMIKNSICDKDNTIFNTPNKTTSDKKTSTYEYSFNFESEMYCHITKYQQFRKDNYESKMKQHKERINEDKALVKNLDYSFTD